MGREIRAVRALALVVVLLIAVFAIGYGIFVFFVKGFAPTTGTLSLLAFALVGGIATFFSPCSFPLMPGYLTRHLQTVEKTGRKVQSIGILSNGLSAAAGVFLFDIILGLSIVLLGTSFAGSLAISTSDPNFYVRVFRGSVGLLLILLGILSLKETGVFHNDALTSFGRRLIKSGQLKPNIEMFAYGFGYVSVGIGCAGPILSGLLLFALSFGGAADAIIAFMIFATVMASLMIGVSLLVSASPSALTTLTTRGPQIKKAAAIVQVAVGGFLALAAYYNTLFVQLLFPS